MTDYPYIAPCSYFLIYMYEIPGLVDHAGIRKGGHWEVAKLVLLSSTGF